MFVTRRRYPYGHGGPYHQYAAGAGSAPYTETVYQRDTEGGHQQQGQGQGQHGAAGSSSIAFRDPEEAAHDLAYQGYQNYKK